jgi:hypothetical protein
MKMSCSHVKMVESMEKLKARQEPVQMEWCMNAIFVCRHASDRCCMLGCGFLWLGRVWGMCRVSQR